MKLVSALQMQDIEKIAIEQFEIPALILMENAAVKIYNHIESMLEKKSHITVIAGIGNNGGDALALARHLFNNGYSLEIIIIGDESKYKTDALVNYKIVKNLNISISYYNSLDNNKFIHILQKSDLIIDGIFGTGLSRKIDGDYKRAIEDINNFSKNILSIDIPSGINSDNGEIMGTAIKATETVTLGYHKKGLFLYPGYKYSGKITLADISIPKISEDDYKLETESYTDNCLKNKLPKRSTRTNKGSFGKSYVFAGNSEMTGAPFLTSKAIYKIGGGIVYGCFIKEVAKTLQTLLPEAVFKILPDYKGSYCLESYKYIYDELKNNADVIAIGPGIGRKEATEDFVKELLTNINITYVIDADALNIISDNIELFNNIKSLSVITPHPGEMSRLLKTSIDKVLKNPIESALTLSEKYNLVTVLKDNKTIITSPNGEVYINNTGNNSLAKAGSGDVLTGIITGLIAQKMNPFEASKLGVYIHGKAGELASLELSEYGVLASQVIDFIPHVIKKII